MAYICHFYIIRVCFCNHLKTYYGHIKALTVTLDSDVSISIIQSQTDYLKDTALQCIFCKTLQ